MAGILPDDEVSARKVTIATIYLLSIFFIGGLRSTIFQREEKDLALMGLTYGTCFIHAYIGRYFF
jgi:hypothetical protein